MIPEKKLCPTCGQNVSEREIGLYRGMVKSLWEVYKWAKAKNIHEFTRRDMKHLLKNENDSARFGDWVMFGGLVYKHGKGNYGLNLQRCEDFFAGRLAIATSIWKNPITKELKPENYRLITEIPTIAALLNQDLEYVVRYR